MTSVDQFNPPAQPPSRSSCLPVAVIVVALLAGVVTILAMAAFVFLPLVFESMQTRAQRHPAVARKLPALSLQPLTGDGQPVTLEDIEGEVVLINFWGTWCPPCVEELPDIAALEKKYRGRAGFRLLAVSCGPKLEEDLDELRIQTGALLDVRGIDMPTYADPEQVSRLAFGNVDGFDGYPTTLILDRDQVIRGVWVGTAPPEELEAMIVRLLEQ